MDESIRENHHALAIIRKLNAEHRAISKNSKSSNGSKRGVPSNLASNRSVSFVSRKAFGDITESVNLEVENLNNSINHNPMFSKQLQIDHDHSSNVST